MSHATVFVAPVPSAEKEKYFEISKALSRFFKEKGALRYIETWGTDVPSGKLTSFPMAVQLKEDETIALAWIEWPSKADGDKAWEAMQEDRALMELMSSAPMDGQRMIFGGFEVMIDL